MRRLHTLVLVVRVNCEQKKWRADMYQKTRIRAPSPPVKTLSVHTGLRTTLDACRYAVLVRDGWGRRAESDARRQAAAWTWRGRWPRTRRGGRGGGGAVARRIRGANVSDFDVGVGHGGVRVVCLHVLGISRRGGTGPARHARSRGWLVEWVIAVQPQHVHIVVVPQTHHKHHAALQCGTHFLKLVTFSVRAHVRACGVSARQTFRPPLLAKSLGSPKAFFCVEQKLSVTELNLRCIVEAMRYCGSESEPDTTHVRLANVERLWRLNDLAVLHPYTPNLWEIARVRIVGGDELRHHSDLLSSVDLEPCAGPARACGSVPCMCGSWKLV